MLFGQDNSFWIAAIVAAAIKVAASDKFHIARALITFSTAVFCAWAFTGAILDWMNLKPETYTVPMAALVAVTGENLMRLTMIATSDMRHVVTIIKAWRGK